jgi:hypothetical protein
MAAAASTTKFVLPYVAPGVPATSGSSCEDMVSLFCRRRRTTTQTSTATMQSNATAPATMAIKMVNGKDPEALALSDGATCPPSVVVALLADGDVLPAVVDVLMAVVVGTLPVVVGGPAFPVVEPPVVPVEHGTDAQDRISKLLVAKVDVSSSVAFRVTVYRPSGTCVRANSWSSRETVVTPPLPTKIERPPRAAFSDHELPTKGLVGACSARMTGSRLLLTSKILTPFRPPFAHARRSPRMEQRYKSCVALRVLTTVTLLMLETSTARSLEDSEK